MKHYQTAILVILVIVVFSWKFQFKPLPARTSTRAIQPPALLAGAFSPTPFNDSCDAKWKAFAELEIGSLNPNAFHIDDPERLIDQILSIKKTHPCQSADPKLSELEQNILGWCSKTRDMGIDLASYWSPTPDLQTSEGALQASSTIDKCLFYLTSLRQELADRSLANSEIAKTSDTTLLFHKLLAQGQRKPSDPVVLHAIAKRLSELDGNTTNPEIAEIVFTVEYGLLVRSEEFDIDTLSRAYDICRAAGKNSEQLIEFDLDRGELELAKELALSLQKRGGGENIASYYLAQIAHREGDFNETVRLLKHVLKGELSSYKQEAYIALKRMQTEGPQGNGSLPLFPRSAIGVQSLFSYAIPRTSQETRAYSNVRFGFDLVRAGLDGVMDGPYRAYIDEASQWLRQTAQLREGN